MFVRAPRTVRSTALVALLVLVALLGLLAGPGGGAAQGAPDDELVAGRKWGLRATTASVTQTGA